MFHVKHSAVAPAGPLASLAAALRLPPADILEPSPEDLEEALREAQCWMGRVPPHFAD